MPPAASPSRVSSRAAARSNRETFAGAQKKSGRAIRPEPGHRDAKESYAPLCCAAVLSALALLTVLGADGDVRLAVPNLKCADVSAEKCSFYSDYLAQQL